VAENPARRTAGRWGSVCGARAWTGETNGARGEKFSRRPVARFKGGVGQRREGGPAAGMSRGTGRVGPGSNWRAAS
jgi:hypothetical protein